MSRKTATGFKLSNLASDVVEMRVKYDDFAGTDHDCGIGDNFNANHSCQIVFDVEQDMNPPILIHYELTNFHQNHRDYFQSRDDFQLLGRVHDQDPVSKQRCKPLNTLGGLQLNPCGFAANTFFNDIFTLVEGTDAGDVNLTMIEEGIAWQSDVDFAFAQPHGFRYSLCPPDGSSCEESCCTNIDEDGEYADLEWSCKFPFHDKKADACYRYYYPRDNVTQYLYETYPDIISPLEGVTNEHFIVWMRTATQPTFRKLYGWIDQPIRQGERLVFDVKANFVVSRFRGTKSLIVSTNNIFGGENPYLGPSFYWIGFYCLLAGAFFTLKQVISPRKLADPNHLHYKVD